MNHPQINPFATPQMVQTDAELPSPGSRRKWSTLMTGLVGGVLLGGTFGAGTAGLLGVLFCFIKTEEFRGGDELLGTAFAIGSAGAFIGGFLGLGAGALVGSLAAVLAVYASPPLVARLPWITAVMAMAPAGCAACLAGLILGGFSSGTDVACVVLAILIGLAAGWCGGFQLGAVIGRHASSGGSAIPQLRGWSHYS